MHHFLLPNINQAKRDLKIYVFETPESTVRFVERYRASMTEFFATHPLAEGNIQFVISDLKDNRTPPASCDHVFGAYFTGCFGTEYDGFKRKSFSASNKGVLVEEYYMTCENSFDMVNLHHFVRKDVLYQNVVV